MYMCVCVACMYSTREYPLGVILSWFVRYEVATGQDRLVSTIKRFK